jgi:hypothetical protein
MYFAVFKMRSHHVAQAGSELLSSSDLFTSASQVAGTAGVCNHGWQNSVFLSHTVYGIWL